jgi:hypothetical protein
VQDLNDNYQFLYPFGWQEVTVTGADVVYKDVVEPLESVSVTITPTDKKDITEFGEITDVSRTVVRACTRVTGLWRQQPTAYRTPGTAGAWRSLLTGWCVGAHTQVANTLAKEVLTAPGNDVQMVSTNLVRRVPACRGVLPPPRVSLRVGAPTRLSTRPHTHT